MLDRSSKVFVAGHRGLAGSALSRCLIKRGFTQIVTRTRTELDLTDQVATYQFFKTERPKTVLLAAAKVGGIGANERFPADFIEENLSIQNNVIGAAFSTGVQNLIFLGSSCIYPRDCPQPIKEQYLLDGPLEPTNRAYAVAKIAGIEACWAHNRQHGTRYIAVMPTNLYGPGDNYDLETSHVLPALIRKVHEAKQRKLSEVSVWGTGLAWREFLYSDDLAGACIFLLDRSTEDLGQLFSNHYPPLVNIGMGTELQIHELVSKIIKVVGYNGTIQWDQSRPDGTPRKLLDSSLISSFGWKASTQLDQGIGLAYDDFLSRYGS